MIKRLLIISIILSSLELYNISALGESIVKMAQIAGIGLLVLIIVLQSVYNREAGFKLNFKWEITAIFIALLLSVLMAYSGHGQSFSITIIAQRFMYFYLFYFALHQIRIPDFELENIMLYLASIHAIFYIIQFLAYPTILFDVRVASDRGTIRIFLQGLTYVILAYFYTLHKLYDNFRLSRLLFLLFLFSIFILMGTRQLIFTMFMLTMINVLLSNKVKSKTLIFSIVVLATIPVFFMFQNIFLNMFKLSETQSAAFADDIRVR